jgi:hypothetical protein
MLCLALTAQAPILRIYSTPSTPLWAASHPSPPHLRKQQQVPTAPPCLVAREASGFLIL